MINKLKAGLLFLLLFPCCSFALTPGDYFQQAVIVTNDSTHDILITDPSFQSLQNYQLEPEYSVKASFPSDRFTNAAGQTFTHTITINSAVDYSPICTVTSSLFLSADSSRQSAPTTSNDLKCKTSSFQEYGANGVIYGFEITVIG